MNNFIEYVCRGVIRSEDAIRHLRRNVSGLVKCTRNLSTSVICLGVAGVLLTAVIYDQDKDIKALKKQVAALAKDAEAKNEPVTDNMEEQTQQEGA
jgi:hypothetical protein